MSTEINPWMQFMSNPKSHYIKKSMFELLKERYTKHEDIVERISVSLLTDKDMTAFLQLSLELYEIGYLRSVEDHREQLEKIGIKVSVVAPDQKSK
jgi:hypothetical protein